VFDKGVFPFSSLHPNAGAQFHSKILLLPPPLHNSYEGEFVAADRTNGANVANTVVEPHVQGEELTVQNSLAALGEQTPMPGARAQAAEGGATPDPGASTSNLSREYVWALVPLLWGEAISSGALGPQPDQTSAADTCPVRSGLA
jgi:hypothetical protein